MKMLAENAALYRQRPVKVKQSWLALICLALLSCCSGCPGNQKPSNQSADKPAAPAPGVPLRVWFVAEAADKAVIERQWQATYDRPLEITMFTSGELLQQSKPACDTLVYPAWMLGDLVARDWLAELPSKLQDSQAAQKAESESVALPAGWIEQARINRKVWALSLSVLPTVVMANTKIPEAKLISPNESATVADSVAYWQSVIDAMQAAKANTSEPPAQETKETNSEDKSVVIDPLAVCDRYLTILFSVSDNENTIGSLFQPEQLEPRVKNSNFVKAAEIMRQLHETCASAEAMLASHDAAWQTLSSSELNVTISIPPRPSAEADKINSIVVSRPPASPARSGMRVSSGWNSGRGLMVSISKQCRQTGVSIDFASWLASDASRQVFAKSVAGIHAESAYAPGSSAWQAQRVVQLLGQQSRLPSEPRLPHSLEYRQVLGEQIATALLGKKTVEDALAEVDRAWREITTQSDPKIQIPAYQQSLGL